MQNRQKMKIMNKRIGWQTLLELQSVSVSMSFYFWGFVKVEVKMHTRSLRLSRVVDNSEIRRTNPVVLTALTESVTPSATGSLRTDWTANGTDRAPLSVAPSASASATLQTAVRTSSSDAISLLTGNRMNFAFLDTSLCRLVFKTLEAIHGMCSGQDPLQWRCLCYPRF